MADVEGKKLTELRVIDLKTELERRGLDKSGNKAALLERLSKAILDEGGNPEEHLIVPSGGPPKIIPKRNGGALSQEDSSIECSDHQKEENIDGQDNIDKYKMEVKTEEFDEKEVFIGKEGSIKKEVLKEESELEIKNIIIKVEKLEDKMQGVKAENAPNSDKKNETEKITSNQTSDVPSATVEANGIDNEDSINLTIGEDEENLLAEETESHDRHKDGGEKKKMEENSKKGDPKGSGRAEPGAGGKEGTTSGANGTKIKQEGGDGGSKSAESSNKSQKREEKDKKTSQINPTNASSRNLWVSGLSSSTRATDLKQIFSKYGKVIGAKVVTNARTPGARCYGYVTMSSSEDAAKCIQHLHRTELHGRVISVEKAKGDTQQSHIRKRDTVNGKSEKKEEKEKPKDHDINERKEKEIKKEPEEKGSDATKKTDDKNESVELKIKIEMPDKKEDLSKESDSRSTKSTSKKPESERGRREEKRIRTWERDHRSHSRSRSRERRKRDDVLTFAKIREERERQRMRERERMLREEERRRREDMERQREIERRHREESARLEREREKLRRERERIEQEKAELLRLERERQKLEREKLERERLELKRQQMRLEESRRVPPPPSIKRSSSDRRDPRDLYAESDRKRLATEHSRRHSPERIVDRRNEMLERVSDRRLDPSPPSRYESSRSTQELGLKKEFKRSSDFSSRNSRPDSFSDVSRGREVIVRRESLSTTSSSLDPRQVKERYDRPNTTSYTREREVRRSDPETHRSSRDTHTRYSDSFKPPTSSTPRESRYVESNRTPSWHSGPTSSKSFNSVTSSGSRDPRNEPSSWSSRSSDSVNRWSNSSSMGNTLRHPIPPTYQSGPMQSMGLAAPGTAPSYERFEAYKSSMPMRKY
ncbi:PREDICTED: SAFB-like transcription modulator isoform X1 [Acromyrmex echinatior]|uniref:SAFB-like transcription modulator isoform X1 n=1 Tax=Acromyrmex echinatior TaxID=103372 RepID=UPI000580C46D|nr:PREDICTED: SAFB-like transcription modulator isoform X1 [Acromyrmex echinatior]